MSSQETVHQLWKGFGGHGLYAKRAEQDRNGDDIVSTYAKKSDVPALTNELNTSSTTAVTPNAVKESIDSIVKIPDTANQPSTLYVGGQGMGWTGWDSEEIDVPQTDFFYEWWSEFASEDDKQYYKKTTLSGIQYEYLDTGKNNIVVPLPKIPKLVEFDTWYASTVGAIDFAFINSAEITNMGHASHDIITRPHYQLNLNYAMMFNRWDKDTGGVYPDAPSIVEHSGTYNNWLTSSFHLGGSSYEYAKYMYSTNVATRQNMHYRYDIDAENAQVRITVTGGGKTASMLLQYADISINRFMFSIERVSYRNEVGFKNLHIMY